jgi:hypothetical protein
MKLSYPTFARFEAGSEKANEGFFPGVLVIENGPAKGHFAVKLDSGRVVEYDSSNPEHAKLQKYPIYIADATLDDVVRCGNAAEVTKCKLDHGSTVKDIVGNYARFRRDGEQVRADLSVMDSTPHRPYVLELVAKMAKKIGNSIDFDYDYEIVGGRAVARCVNLNSVDIVDSPAATNSLFHQNNNPSQLDMPLSTEDLAAIGGIISKEVSSQLSTVKTDFNNRFEEMKTKMEEYSPDKEEKKEEKKEESATDDAKLASLVKSSTLAAVREVLPKAVLANLESLGNRQDEKKEGDYDSKHAAFMATGLTSGEATRLMARKHPALYTAKFGAGEGGKGSASTGMVKK